MSEMSQISAAGQRAVWMSTQPTTWCRPALPATRTRPETAPSLMAGRMYLHKTTALRT
jgi:hypothetical protein